MGHDLLAIFQAVDRRMTEEEQDFLRTHCPQSKVTNRRLSMSLEDTNLKLPGDVNAMMRRGLDAGFSERSNGDRHYWFRLSQAPPAAFEVYNPRKGRRLYDWIPDESGPGGVFRMVQVFPLLFCGSELPERIEDLVFARRLLEAGDLSLLFMGNLASRMEMRRSMPVPLTLLRDRDVGRRLAWLLTLDLPVFEMLNREQQRWLQEDVNWVPDKWRLSVEDAELLAFDVFQNGGLDENDGGWDYEWDQEAEEEEEDEIPADALTDEEAAAEESGITEGEIDWRPDATAPYRGDFAADPRSTAAKILKLMKTGNDDDLRTAVLQLWYLTRQVQGTEYQDLPAQTMERMLELTSKPSLLVSLLSEVSSGE